MELDYCNECEIRILDQTILGKIKDAKINYYKTSLETFSEQEV